MEQLRACHSKQLVAATRTWGRSRQTQQEHPDQPLTGPESAAQAKTAGTHLAGQVRVRFPGSNPDVAMEAQSGMTTHSWSYHTPSESHSFSREGMLFFPHKVKSKFSEARYKPDHTGAGR
jgi:hypothetical protein